VTAQLDFSRHDSAAVVCDELLRTAPMGWFWQVIFLAQKDRPPAVVVVNAKTVVSAHCVWNMPRLTHAESVNRAEARYRKLAARSDHQGDRKDANANERHGPNEN
jgi:hypothetical protein